MGGSPRRGLDAARAAGRWGAVGVGTEERQARPRVGVGVAGPAAAPRLGKVFGLPPLAHPLAPRLLGRLLAAASLAAAVRPPAGAWCPQFLPPRPGEDLPGQSTATPLVKSTGSPPSRGGGRRNPALALLEQVSPKPGAEAVSDSCEFPPLRSVHLIKENKAFIEQP